MVVSRNRDLQQDYFHWLCEMVHIDQEDRTYWLVAKDLHSRIFVPIIERDENRAMDGLELRDQYLEKEWYSRGGEFDIDECTVFEMLVALAQRIDFETSNTDDGQDRTAYWFWEMITNLGLDAFDDDSYVELEGQVYVDKIIDEFVEREYEYNGEGGIFPLRHCDRDQRNVEIWYQMSAYLYERE